MTPRQTLLNLYDRRQTQLRDGFHDILKHISSSDSESSPCSSSSPPPAPPHPLPPPSFDGLGPLARLPS
jgi:hypothetical protein